MAVLVGTGWWAVRTFWLNAPPFPRQVAVAHGSFATDGRTTAIQTETTKVYGEGHPYSPVPIYEAGKDDVLFPTPIFQPEPAYTRQARKDKVQGTVVLSVVLDTSGNVTDVRLVKAVGKGLDESAIETIRAWKFHPALKKGYPVPVRVIVETTFRLF